MKRTPLRKRSTSPSSVKARKRSAMSKADVKRAWGIDASYTLRYAGLKGILWYWFARYVRMRDFLRWKTCISCGKLKSFEELQAGHFAPAGTCGLELLFDPHNVHGECGGCNAFDQFHLVGYSKNLDKRYGSGTADILNERYQLRHQTTYKISTPEYENLIRLYKSEFEMMQFNASHNSASSV